MIDATMIFVGSTTTTLYSPWFPRGGDFVVLTAEAIQKSGTTGILKIDLITKAVADQGDGALMDTSGATNITFNNPTIPARTSVDWKRSATVKGCSELCRYKFTMSGTAGDWMLFRVLPPQWYDKVDVT